ncbi:L-dopachrome tautomerase yellow-f2-like [Lutzomyia longipalpis]|uniref:L-dopachrome tautomerase yellow-f2-like n=1 Tax=Lutzomyia longipalpis TaxID=7200 RepID=UPI00248365DD|nr:L-dopachrome tautomerase yellow-f2-like [Lutzomyia longipalpis]
MKRVFFHLILCLITIGYKSCSYAGYMKEQVEVAFKWNRVEFVSLPQPADSWVGPYRYFIPENNDIVGLGYHPASGLMVVTLERLRLGVPATIAAFCVKEYRFGSNPKFWAFPNFEIQAMRASDFTSQSRGLSKKSFNQGKNIYNWNSYYEGIYNGSYHNLYQKPINNYKPTYLEPAILAQDPSSNDFRIISVYEVMMDEKCNRAFFLDAGMVQYDNVSTIIQKPAILVYDLPYNGCQTRNFQLIRRVEFPDDLATMSPYSNFHMTLDFQSNQCDDLYIYVANFFGHLIVVYDYKRNDFWYFTGHPSFQPVASESYIVYDETLDFLLPVGIYTIALGYRDKNGDRPAYYVAGASTAQYVVSTKILKDKRKSPTNYNANVFKIKGYRGCFSQASKMAVDYTYGVVFYAELQSRRISCWNVNKPLNPDNIGVIYESDEPFFPLAMFIDSHGYLWFSSGRVVYLFFTSWPIDLNENNFNFYRIKVSDAIKGTICEE